MKEFKFVSWPKVYMLSAIALAFIFSACSSLVLKPVDFSWPLESVLKVDNDGFIKEDRHSIIVDTRNLFLKETGDSSAYMNKEVRVIRDSKGFYYITAENFKNVYVFKSGEGQLSLDNKIEISETGISSPAFNQRLPYIEIVYGDKKHLLTNDGIKENEEKK